jgi:hypothetical protein
MSNSPSRSFPVVHFIARHAHAVAAVIGLALIWLGIWAMSDGAPLWAGLSYIGGGVVGYVLLRSYGELARILLDILMPQ